MGTIFLRKMTLAIITILLAGVMLLGHSLANEATVGVKVAEKDGIGKYLTDGSGMTLYTFANDAAGVSNCTGDCLAKWPPFYVDPAAVVEGCEVGDFGSITRDNGSEQTTYKGMPLYYFFNDSKPGDTTGQGAKGVWYVATP